MNAFTALVLHRWSQRRRLLATAGVAALVPFMLALFTEAGAAEPDGVRLWSACLVALILALVAAPVLGASMLARPLAEGRSGFVYEMPLPPFALWGGYLAADSLLHTALLATILVPPTLATPAGRSLWTADPGAVALLGIGALIVAATLLLQLLAHALAVLFNARSLWLLADAGGALAVTALQWTAWSPLWPIEPKMTRLGLGVTAGAVLAALAVAGWAQVRWGRIDPRRSHRALSLTLWPLLIAASLAALGYSWWFRTPNPGDLVTCHDAAAAPAGDWLEVVGRSRGRGRVHPAFLANPTTGAFVALPPGRRVASLRVAFSSDGRRGAWLDGPAGDTGRLWVAELGEQATVRDTGIIHGNPVRLRLSVDGSRAVVLHDDALEILDLQRKQVVARHPMEGRVDAHFDDGGALRILSLEPEAGERDQHRVRIMVLDPVTAEPRVTGTISALAPDVGLRMAPSMDRLLVLQTRDGLRRTSLHDGVDGSLVAHLATTEVIPRRRFLTDERVLLAVRSEDTLTLALHSPDGVPLTSHTLPVSRAFFLGAELAPAVVPVYTIGEVDSVQGRRPTAVQLVDLDSGGIETLKDLHLPVLVRSGTWFQDSGGGAPSGLLLDPSWTLVRWSPDGGTRAPVLERTW